jgi:uncharacterized protein (TIGR03437 family)
LDNCFGLFPSVCSGLTALTVQLPWELVPNIPGAGRPVNFAVVTVQENGMAGEAFPLQPVTDNIHVLTSCDAVAVPNPEPVGGCHGAIRHPDGRLVTSEHPAVPGQTLTMDAYGLGRPGETPQTGAAAAEALPFPDVAIEFRYGTNLAPARPVQSGTRPLFAGLAAGEVGVYRIVFQVPPVPAGTKPCLGGSIRSNLTVSIARQVSFDGAGVCVDPGN